MNGAEVADQIVTSPDPEAQSGPDPDPDAPAGSMSGMVTFSPAAIRGFVERGFLTVQDPSFDDVAQANFKMLTAAWKAGVRADGQASPSSANDAEEETSVAFSKSLPGSRHDRASPASGCGGTGGGGP